MGLPIFPAVRSGIPIGLAGNAVDIVARIIKQVAETALASRAERIGKTAIISTAYKDIKVHASGIVENKHDVCRRREYAREYRNV